MPNSCISVEMVSVPTILSLYALFSSVFSVMVMWSLSTRTCASANTMSSLRFSTQRAGVSMVPLMLTAFGSLSGRASPNRMQYPPFLSFNSWILSIAALVAAFCSSFVILKFFLSETYVTCHLCLSSAVAA